MGKQSSFHDKVIYQIYPRSFCDSNGDGIGDIQGIISKLDYLHDLGVDVMWLSPIYQSPLLDMGYDISDYYSIHPDYGTMEDFDSLLEEARKRDIRVVMDLVVNHTSSEHPWFIKSKDPSSPYRDYYYWREGRKNGTKPPNNWTSMFVGEAWKKDEEGKGYYLHLYSEGQPDLNFHNEKVVEEVERILRFYLDKGVYGFRCDVINQCFKESLDNGRGFSPYARGIEHYLCTPGNHRLLRRFYDDVFSHYDCIVIGETFGIDLENGREYLENHELDMFFQFETANVGKRLIPIFSKRFKPRELREAFYKWQTGVSWNANYLENHDQLRSISRYGNPDNLDSGKALAAFLFTLRGTPFIYQGQEIGMSDLPPVDPKKSLDVSCRTVDKLMRRLLIPKPLRVRWCHNINRDNARTPVQWDDGVSAGFSTNPETWLPVNSNYPSVNVKNELADPSSLLNFYKKLTKLRKEDPVFQEGSFLPIKVGGDLIAFQREYQGKRRFVLINLRGKAVKIPRHIYLSQAKLLLSSLDKPAYQMGLLSPYEADIFDLN